jgi:PHD/YefM family antitoxin component YafN of YafNO toxin-antitoxin module
MKIIPSKTLRTDYSSVSAEAHETAKPIFVTKSGAQDLVVMSHEAYLAREAELDRREKVLEAEADLLAGGATYTIDELRDFFAERESQAAAV